MRARGAHWNGETAYAHGDEVTYAAYLNALIDGRPRRNDPYAGRDERADAPPTESYISIQFVPPLLIATAARALHFDTARALVCLIIVGALSCALTLFSALALVLRDGRLAAAGTICTLYLASTNQVAAYALHLGTSNNYVPFLRLYVPIAAFPFFFAFLALVYLSLARAGRAGLFAACGAGAAFALLVFSYFYLWTTAAAWMLALAALWFFARPLERRRLFARLVIISTFALAALIPYALLLAHRAANTEEGLLLTRSFRPDLFRLPEIFGAATLLGLCFAARRRHIIAWRERETLFAAACALTPFIVFNQQIVTGLSLQPFHFAMFSANYVATLGAFLYAALICRAWASHNDASPTQSEQRAETRAPSAARTSDDSARSERTGASHALSSRFALVVAALALTSGTVETYIACRTRLAGNVARDAARPAALRLAALGHNASGQTLDTRSLVLMPNYTVADSLPTIAPQPVLWSPHMFNHPGVTIAEDHERLMRWLYFSGEDFAGVDPARFDALDGRRKFLVASLISRERLNPNLRADWKPVTTEEARAALGEYANYAATFSRERAAQLPLSYLLVDSDEPFDSKNLDRWYERDAGERIGRFVIYRVRLRQDD